MLDEPTDSDLPPDAIASLDSLVRAGLDRRADAVDPRALFARIQASAFPPPVSRDNTSSISSAELVAARSIKLQPSSSPAHAKLRRWLAWGGGLSAAAAAVLIGFVLLGPGTPAQASPETILREAQQLSKAPKDRCYLVEVRKQSDVLDQNNPMASQSRMTLLRTRGQQYWMTPINTPQPFAWGRDGAGDFWLALGPKQGIRFEPDETPPWLRLSADVLSMQVDKLLDEVLRDFDVSQDQPTEGQPASTVAIQANLKAGHRHPALKGARIEFDRETKLVRKLVLERTRSGQPVATVTYLLIDTAPRDDHEFELEWHLEAPYRIFNREDDPQRRGMLLRFFGMALGEPPPGRALNPNGPGGLNGSRPLRPMFQPLSRPSTQLGAS